MDPALWELLLSEETTGEQEVEAVVRLRRPGADVPGLRIVSGFGRVATCRLSTSEVRRVRAHPEVVSLKAARALGPEPERVPAATSRAVDVRRPPGLSLTGAGVVLAAVDWGVDVDAECFKHADGSSRLLALWDQRGPSSPSAPRPYGYGTVHDRDAIDAALRSGSPFEALGYHPSVSDSGGGAHGTHVLDIAAGNGRGGGPAGIAPGADLVFVHLADRGTGGLSDLGDSVRLLEAVDFVARTAGDRPWVVNLSVGRHGGPHDGTTLVELAFDELLAAAPGRFIVQSTGNYFRSGSHASGVVAADGVTSLWFETRPEDTTTNELEIWYDGADELVVSLAPPGPGEACTVPLGDRAELRLGGRVAGRIYHRANDPNNGDHHVDAFLYPWAPAGAWRVTLMGRRVRRGTFHAWLERDEACTGCQARFTGRSATSNSTTGTLANGRLPLVVGAYDARTPLRPAARFTSAGPTRDDRPKPDVAAPGVAVLAARSAPRGSPRSGNGLVRKSGSSMATPHVTGAVALCLEHLGQRASAQQVRDLVLGTVQGTVGTDPDARLGRGYLDIPRLVASLRRAPPPTTGLHDTEELIMSTSQPGHPDALARTPAAAYRHLLYRPGDDLARLLAERYDLVARPGQPFPGEVLAGDLLVRVRLGRPGVGECVPLASAGLVRRRRGPQGPGWYAPVVSENGARERRVLDADRCLPPGQLILRGRPPATLGSFAGDDELVESSLLDRLVQQGDSENQITSSLLYAQHPGASRKPLRPGSALAKEWLRIRAKEVRPAVRASLVVTEADPVQLAVFLSQYEGDSRVPSSITRRFLTQPVLLSMGRSLRDRVLSNWANGHAPLTPLRLYEMAFELSGDPGTATLLCHNVTKAFVREGEAIHWKGTGTEGEYTDGSRVITARLRHRSGKIRYFHKGKGRSVLSMFYLLFSPTEFGTDDPGDWYHFFVTATMTAHASSGTLGAITSRRGREEDGEDRGGTVGPVLYRGLVQDRVTELERQMSDASMRGAPGYRGWVLANVLSFLEGGHYGKDYAADQSDVLRESRVHLRGASFGLRTIGRSPGRGWRWYVPKAGSVTKLDLATGISLSATTDRVWGPDMKPLPAGETYGDVAVEDAAEEAAHVAAAKAEWTRLFGEDRLLKQVRILDMSQVPARSVRDNEFEAWTNAKDRVYVSDTADDEEGKLTAVLHHEMLHVRQFARWGRPPKAYAEMMRFECDAYSQSADWLKAQTNSSVRAFEAPMRAQAAVFCDQITAVEKSAAKPADRERLYKAFLQGCRLLPKHASLGELYRPPGKLRNPKAVEAWDAETSADVAGGSTPPPPFTWREVEEADDEVADSVSGLELAPEPLDAIEALDAFEAEEDGESRSWMSWLEPFRVGMAIAKGQRDENALANMVFFSRHPELGGRRIRSGETGLAREWLAIRDSVVRPVLRARAPVRPSAAGVPAPAPAPAPAPGPSGRERPCLRDTNSLTALSAWERALMSVAHDRDEESFASIVVAIGPIFVPPMGMAGIPELVVRTALSQDNAITIGSTIWFPRPLDSSTRTDLEWLAHEVTHSVDFETAGTAAFLTSYAAKAVTVLFEHDKIPDEIRADRFGRAVGRLLDKMPTLATLLASCSDPGAIAVELRANRAAYRAAFTEVLSDG